MPMLTTDSLPLLGWSEWAMLPMLGPGRILAKIDTGARSCSLHVEWLDVFERDGIEQVVFGSPVGEHGALQECCLPVVDWRAVTSSSGIRSERLFVRTRLSLGTWEREVEINLVDRHRLRHPMLIGRAALAGAWHVDPAQRFALGGHEAHI